MQQRWGVMVQNWGLASSLGWSSYFRPVTFTATVPRNRRWHKPPQGGDRGPGSRVTGNVELWLKIPEPWWKWSVKCLTRWKKPYTRLACYNISTPKFCSSTLCTFLFRHRQPGCFPSPIHTSWITGQTILFSWCRMEAFLFLRSTEICKSAVCKMSFTLAEHDIRFFTPCMCQVEWWGQLNWFLKGSAIKTDFM